MAALDIKLKRVNKIYHEGEVLAGVVIVQSKSDVQHQGITLTIEGSVNLQLSSKSVGLFEAFYNSVKPIQLLAGSLQVAKPGKFPAGKTELPFEFPLKAKGSRKLFETYHGVFVNIQAKGSRKLFETYHGVFVNIQYTVKADMKRPLLAKDMTKTVEFIIEYTDKSAKAETKPVSFTVTPETLQNIKEQKTSLPKFKVHGKLDSSSCSITKPLTGHVVVDECAVPIKSVEIQLVRVETCGCAEGYARDATEIQNIQIGEGDVCRGITIPIHMVFPRLFTCPTVTTTNFKVGFEVNLVIVLKDEHYITENFPLELFRF